MESREGDCVNEKGMTKVRSRQEGKMDSLDEMGGARKVVR